MNITNRYDNYNSHPLLCQLAQALNNITGNILNVSYQYVPGHKGEPYNELVDRLCTCYQVQLTQPYASIIQLLKRKGTPLHPYINHNDIHHIDFFHILYMDKNKTSIYPEICYDDKAICQPFNGYIPTMQYAPNIIAQHMDKPLKKTIRGNKQIIASNLNIIQFNCAISYQQYVYIA